MMVCMLHLISQTAATVHMSNTCFTCSKTSHCCTRIRHVRTLQSCITFSEGPKAFDGITMLGQIFLIQPISLDHGHSKEVIADLACTVKGAPVCWLLVAVGLQLALDDVSRVDCEPVHCPCCTPSYHEGPLPQLICIAQTLLETQSHPSMQRHCHVHGTVCFLSHLHAVPPVQLQQERNVSVM